MLCRVLSNHLFHLCYELRALLLLQTLSHFFYLRCLFDLFGELFYKESVIPSPWSLLLRQQIERLHCFFSTLYLFCLLLLLFAFLLEFCIDLTLFCFSDQTIAVLDLFALFFFAVSDFLLLAHFFSFLFFALATDARVCLVGKLYKLNDATALLLEVFAPRFLVLLLHIAALVAISSFTRIILIILGEVAPGLKVIPILVKFVDLL